MKKGAKDREMLPWSRSCFVCGEENERGMKARSFLSDGQVELAFLAPEEFSGWRSVIHGGLVATVLDEVMTWAAIVGARKPCFTAEFTVRMVRPLPPGTACRALGRLVQDRRRLFITEGSLEGRGGVLFARAEGRYMVVPLDRMDEFKSDFICGPGCHDIEDVLNFGSA